jgi:phosphatidylinositol 3-kinase
VGFIILCEQVWDLSHGEGLIGGATIVLFNNKKQLKTGKQKLRLWAGKEADGTFPTSTPGKVNVHFKWLYS